MNLVATLQCKGGDDSRDIEVMWNPKSELLKITLNTQKLLITSKIFTAEGHL